MTIDQLDTPFIPTRDDMTAIYNGIGVTQLDEGDVIVLTNDSQDALDAFTAHCRAHGYTPTDDELDCISIRYVVFTRPSDDESTWVVTPASPNEWRPTTIVAWFED